MRKLDKNDIRILLNYAEQGDRIVLNKKNIWAGLGNRSGLHSYANEITAEKFKKGKERLTKKLEAVDAHKDIVEVLTFRNITRDRGRWVCVLTM